MLFWCHLSAIFVLRLILTKLGSWTISWAFLPRNYAYVFWKETISCMFTATEIYAHVLCHFVYLVVVMTLLSICAVIHEPNGPQESSQYEHSSIPATVKKLFNLHSNFLTKRDAWAGTFENYFKIRKTPRTDCPGIFLVGWYVMPMGWTMMAFFLALLLLSSFINDFFTKG